MSGLEKLAQELGVTPEDAALRIAKVLAQVTERESEIITFRFGFDRDGERRTLEETGAEFSLTRERVRQIEQKALARMRHPKLLTD